MAFVEEQNKNGPNAPHYLAHLDYALERIKSPDKAKTYQPKDLLPGALISREETECGR